MKKCNDKMTFIMDNTLYADITTIPLDDGNESNNVIVALAVMVKI